MEMAKVKLSQMAQHGDLLDRYGAKVRVLGRLDMLKPDVLEAVNKAVDMTSRNGDRVLNICFPYTSRDEITSAIRDTVEDYTTPIQQGRSAAAASRFSESHIAHNIRAQTLGSTTHESHSDSESTSGSSGQDDDALPRQDYSDRVYGSMSSCSSSTTLHLGNQQDPKGGSPPRSATEADSPVYISPETISRQTLNDHMLTKGTPPLGYPDSHFRRRTPERLYALADPREHGDRVSQCHVARIRLVALPTCDARMAETNFQVSTGSQCRGELCR
jgi:Undecaprenyl pyrophosphate synthase